MPTTSNFGWTTPADTDLVKDGAAAIRTLGNGIDTSLVDLKGGTTGQVLSKASNTDLDFTWSSVDPLTILDAKGDLITATAADTPARLAVGSNDQVLTADSTTATGLKWAAVSAGGMTSLASGSLPTGATSVTISSISGSYKDLKLYVRGAYMSPTAYRLAIQINGQTSNYRGVIARSNNSATDNNSDVTTTLWLPFFNNAMGTTASQTSLIMTFHDYANTDAFHNVSSCGYNTVNDFSAMGAFTHKSTTAITSITILSEGLAANFSGGTYELFGVK